MFGIEAMEERMKVETKTVTRHPASTGVFARFGADEAAHRTDALHPECSAPLMEEVTIEVVIYELGDVVATLGPTCSAAEVISATKPYGSWVYRVRSLKSGREFVPAAIEGLAAQ